MQSQCTRQSDKSVMRRMISEGSEGGYGATIRIPSLNKLQGDATVRMSQHCMQKSVSMVPDAGGAGSG